MSRSSLWLCAWLGLGHGLADAAAGFVLFGGSASPARAAALLLLYNLIAFALQPAAGFLIDEARKPVLGLNPPALATLAGLLLQALSLALSPFQLSLAVLVAGLGSACFHTGAGALALNTSPTRRGLGLALFTAPGALGLALGSAAALTGTPAGPSLLAALALTSLAIWPQARKIPNRIADQAPPTAAASIPASLLSDSELLLILLLTAIALRSFFWSGTQLLANGHIEALLWLGAGASLGKLAGGPLGTRFGWRFAAVGSLLAALLLSTQALPLLVLGVAALQSSTPLLLDALAQRLPRYPATATGLALGLAIALGGGPLLLPQLPPTPTLWPLLLLLPLLLWPSLNPSAREKICREKMPAPDVSLNGPAA